MEKQIDYLITLNCTYCNRTKQTIRYQLVPCRVVSIGCKICERKTLFGTPGGAQNYYLDSNDGVLFVRIEKI